MHRFAKQIAECVKREIESKGLDHISPAELMVFGQWIDIAKDLAQYDKDMRIIDAMDEENSDDFMERMGYDRYRYDNGRFAPKGRGTRRGYDEPPYFHMTPEMYRGMEHDRDIDRNYGRMYYTETATSGMNMTESGYDKAKRHYTETKEMHKANTAEDKEHKMKSLENYMKELSGDITELLTDMTAEERTMLKSKLSTLVSKM